VHKALKERGGVSVAGSVFGSMRVFSFVKYFAPNKLLSAWRPHPAPCCLSKKLGLNTRDAGTDAVADADADADAVADAGAGADAVAGNKGVDAVGVMAGDTADDKRVAAELTGSLGLGSCKGVAKLFFFESKGADITLAFLFLYETPDISFDCILGISFCKKSTITPPTIPPPPIAGVIGAVTSGNNDWDGLNPGGADITNRVAE